MSETQDYIEVGGVRYLRSRAVARLALVTEGELPTLAQASKTTERQLFWADRRNPDLIHVKFLLDTEGANKNWDYMPREQLVRGHATAVFKPIDMEHIIKEKAPMGSVTPDANVANTICGVMTATALAWAKSGNLLSPKEIDDLDLTDRLDRPDDEKIAVVAYGALYCFIFPKTVAALMDSIKEDTVSVSMERWIADLEFVQLGLFTLRVDPGFTEVGRLANLLAVVPRGD